MTDKTDREMLELAAKAAGMYVLPQPWPNEDGWFFCEQHGEPAMHFRKADSPHRHSTPWMPLTEDGDEARLEAALSLNVEWGDFGVTVGGNPWDSDGDTISGEFEPYHNHPSKQAARRRAGVRAAAEIGRTMP